MPLADVGLTDIVNLVRKRGQASLTDEFDGVTYWTDEQLEEIVMGEGSVQRVRAKPVTMDGLLYELNVPRFYWFSQTGLYVCSSSGTLLDPQPTYSPILGRLTFPSPYKDCHVVVEGFLVNTFAALATLWERKAAQRYNYIQFRGGSTSNNLNQEYEHCLHMQKFYAGKRVRSWKR